ncbi:MAG: NINE protein [Lewinellaceae bacterium]|nr:NINE protein [Phaeodactylibacter sp.]MCB9038053.1 NINE protein [Lewinellaceae bacterium]
MKEKNVAGILALFLGWLGVHRFYLGQTGLGIFYLIFSWLFPVMLIVGLIDAISFFSMDQDVFDRKYNREYPKRRDTDFNRRDYSRRNREQPREARREKRDTRRYDTQRQRQYQRPQPRPPRRNLYKASGIKKYKDYDYDGAIEDFNKSLDIEPNDVATHFNLACAYSLNEKPEKAFFHLDRAVANGFNDFQRIKEHDALAFLRIQPEFDAFEKNGFRQQQQATAEEPPGKEAGEQEEEILEGQTDLLEQLRRLGDLREKGLLTEEEFTSQKRKLLG